MTKCRLVAVRKGHSASRHSPPVINHSPVCQQSARQLIHYALGDEAISPSHQPTRNHSIMTRSLPFSPTANRVEPGPTTDLRRWSRVHLYRSPRSSLPETALATEMCSTSSSCTSSSTVGLSEKEREWSSCSHSSCCGYSPFQRNVTGSLSSATVVAQTSLH